MISYIQYVTLWQSNGLMGGDFFLGPHARHIEVPRLGVESELQQPAYTTAMPDPGHVCNLHHSPWQYWILNPLSKAGD